ncbi:MAG TPA: hypothetical protein PKD17_01905, partial [Cellvibrionaceae bacterium]|nr:hypothetical protein [Cellvibrionaceae bacterium]
MQHAITFVAFEHTLFPSEAWTANLGVFSQTTESIRGAVGVTTGYFSPSKRGTFLTSLHGCI